MLRTFASLCKLVFVTYRSLTLLRQERPDVKETEYHIYSTKSCQR